MDAHAHVYSTDEARYPPVDNPLRPPPGKGTLENLRREMRENGVASAVIVQVSTFYRWDNRFVCDVARANLDSLRGVVTLDPEDKASPEMLAMFVGDSGIRGLRTVPPIDGKYDTAGTRRLWSKAHDLGIPVNALAWEGMVDDLGRLIRDYPDLQIVLDHCLNIKAGGSHDKTKSQVLAFTSSPNVFAKLTFIPTGSAQPYPCKDLWETCKEIVQAYGAERCLWGSDFPCELWCPGVSYGQHLSLFADYLELTGAERRAILGETSRRLWFRS